jgi:hypothetical protein
VPLLSPRRPPSAVRIHQRLGGGSTDEIGLGHLADAALPTKRQENRRALAVQGVPTGMRNEFCTLSQVHGSWVDSSHKRIFVQPWPRRNFGESRGALTALSASALAIEAAGRISSDPLRQHP